MLLVVITDKTIQRLLHAVLDVLHHPALIALHRMAYLAIMTTLCRCSTREISELLTYLKRNLLACSHFRTENFGCVEVCFLVLAVVATVEKSSNF